MDFGYFETHPVVFFALIFSLIGLYDLGKLAVRRHGWRLINLIGFTWHRYFCGPCREMRRRVV